LCHNAGKGAGFTVKLSDVDDLGACAKEVKGLKTLAVEAVASNDIGPGCIKGDVLTARAGMNGFRVEEHKWSC
jgi:hypothetical protein